MDPDKFHTLCNMLANCVQHADARTADGRTTLEPNDSQPLVLLHLWPQPGVCEHCRMITEDRVTQLHWYCAPGWRSHCLTCKMARAPGSTEWGERRHFVKRPTKPAKVNAVKAKPDSQPKRKRKAAPQSQPIAGVPSVDLQPQLVERAVVTEYHGSVITEFVRIAVDPLPREDDVPEPDTSTRKD